MKEQKYCSFCGKELILKTLFDGSKEKYCSNCNHVFFPTPSPAVIIMVTNKNKILLARGKGWKHHHWALISGHIKPDETAEHAATREVREEVGLEVSNPKILKTFAAKDHNLLMIAFKAKAKNAKIKKSKELEDARWFNIDKPIPMRPTSIAANIVRHVYPKVEYINSEKQTTLEDKKK